MDPELKALAQRQGGVFVIDQATRQGTPRSTLGAWVRAGTVRRLARGLYALPERPPTPEERHLQLARGALLLLPDAVLSHWSALIAHGIPVLRVPAQVRLQRPVHRQIRRNAFVVDRRIGASVSTPNGPTTPLANALLDHARLCGVEAGLVSADAALHMGRVSRPDLEATAAEYQGPHASWVNTVACLADPRLESVGESRLRYACHLAGIDLEPQVVVKDARGRFVARVDFLVKGTAIVLEFDGRVKYDHEGALWHEKRREDALRRLGFIVIRVVWDDLRAPEAVVARILDEVRARAS